MRLSGKAFVYSTVKHTTNVRHHSYTDLNLNSATPELWQKRTFSPHFVRTLRSRMVRAVVRDHDKWPCCHACYSESTCVGKALFSYTALSSCSLEQSCILETVLGLAGSERASGELRMWICIPELPPQKVGIWCG